MGHKDEWKALELALAFLLLAPHKLSLYISSLGRRAKVPSRSLGWLELVALTLILRREGDWPEGKGRSTDGRLKQTCLPAAGSLLHLGLTASSEYI